LSSWSSTPSERRESAAAASCWRRKLRRDGGASAGCAVDAAVAPRCCEGGLCMCVSSLEAGDGGVWDLFEVACLAERVLRSLRAEVVEEADELTAEAG
jgi:hypothetical protein